ncbi:MAG: glutamate--tRNA ligase [Gammaproteobacteria bacterium]|nr:glutamate--tRNA ligase [Gammaproteobacteria bacterium]MDE0284321.1 glutamate--tRNA ligase [Gammaproteobacteria bacterium]
MTDKVITRFAPSPTGDLHIGGIRTALFSWLYARRYGGEFLLRIEDTDRERSTDAALDVILKGMEWLGLDHDRDIIYQSHRTEMYKAAIQRLLERDRAYYCYCTREELEAMRAEAMSRGEKPRYNGKWRDLGRLPAAGDTPVVRFKNPLDGDVVIDDLIQGRVVISNRELDDLIIARSDGTPTYNLTVVVDDADMGITHVVRGDDHLNNTPRQINIFDALGVAAPTYAHIPLILDPEGRKLSKRHGAASVLEYQEQGYLPDALLNYLVRLGWSHGDQEIFSRDEMIKLFDIGWVNKAAAALNPDKLAWLNQHYLRESKAEDVACLLKRKLVELGVDVSGPPDLKEVAGIQKERVKTIAEMAEQSRFFYEEFAEYDETAAKKHLRPVALEPLRRVRDALAGLDAWEREALHAAIDAVAEQQAMKFGKIAQPLRVAVTGGAVSPSIDVTLELLGRDMTLSRLGRALELIERRIDSQE